MTLLDEGRARENEVNAAIKIAAEQRAENKRLQALVDEYGLRELDAILQERHLVASQLSELQREIVRQRTEAQHELAQHRNEAQGVLAQLRTEIADAKRELTSVRDQAELQEFGLFDYAHPAESSATLAAELESVRTEIKDMIRSKDAVTASTSFLFNDSIRQGQKFVNQMSQIMLRAYNAEAENCVKTVKAGNLQTAQARLSKARDQIIKQGTMIDLEVSYAYHRLRLRELSLAAQHLQAIQDEKEAEKERRAELREQRKAELEIARAKEKYEKELNHYQATLAALEGKGDLEGAERMRALVVDAEKAIQDLDYRAANIRAGYVYVISNLGSFGENMVKIGLTRRLDPMDRVRELGDASVPFNFDVHALFFANDAVGIETMLHQTFAERRVNKINKRREFFYVRPEEVLGVLKEKRVELLEFNVEPAAEEFHLSRGDIEAKV